MPSTTPILSGGQQYRIIVVGSANTGKTTLVQRLKTGRFRPELGSTIGVDFENYPIRVNNEAVNLQIWDTAGAERYRALSPLYVREAKAAMLVFDLSSKTSFEGLSKWIDFVRAQGDIPFLIIGNKYDKEPLEVSMEDAQAFSHRSMSRFWATSAKTGENVDLAFEEAQQTAYRNWRATVKPEAMEVAQVMAIEKRGASGGDCC
jgi:small GTP-binding protein